MDAAAVNALFKMYILLPLEVYLRNRTGRESRVKFYTTTNVWPLSKSTAMTSRTHLTCKSDPGNRRFINFHCLSHSPAECLLMQLYNSGYSLIYFSTEVDRRALKGCGH